MANSAITDIIIYSNINQGMSGEEDRRNLQVRCETDRERKRTERAGVLQ